MARDSGLLLHSAIALLLAAFPLALAATVWPQYGWSEKLDVSAIPRAVKGKLPADKRPQLRALALSSDGKKGAPTQVFLHVPTCGHGESKHRVVCTDAMPTCKDALWPG